MSEENEGGSHIWVWPVISLIALVFIFILKFDANLRGIFTTDDLTMERWGMIVILIMLISFFGITLSFLSWFSRREGDLEESLLQELNIGEEEEVLVAEIIDEPVKKRGKKAKKPAAKGTKAPEYKIIEYPSKVEDGLFGDTFVKINKESMLKVRTKIAEESDI